MTLKLKPKEIKAIQQVMKDVEVLFNPPPKPKPAPKPKTLTDLVKEDPSKSGVIPPLPPIDFTDSEKARLSDEPVSKEELDILEEQNRQAYNRVRDARLHNLKVRQRNCTHDFQYAGHSHNDDAYECKHCGLMRFE